MQDPSKICNSSIETNQSPTFEEENSCAMSQGYGLSHVVESTLVDGHNAFESYAPSNVPNELERSSESTSGMVIHLILHIYHLFLSRIPERLLCSHFLLR